MNRKVIRYLSYDGLLNAGTSDFLVRDDELVEIKNVWIYKIGKLEKVPGYELTASSQIVNGEDVNYLHWYFNTNDRTNYLLATSAEGSDLTLEYHAPNAGTPVTGWNTIGSISTSWDGYAGSFPDMENYLGKTFIVGHKTGDTYLPNATVEGTVFNSSDSDISDMPQGKFIVRYRDLLYVLHTRTGGDTYPSRAYFSDEPTDGEIGWTNLTTQFIEFGYDDGDEITGAAEALDKLIVFKNRSMWKYDESERKKVADVGCDSYRSIEKVSNVLYWFNRYGFWRWRGAEPELISSKAQEYIDAIDQTKLGEIVATQYNGFEYRAFIGNVTVGSHNYNNAWFCWDTRRETCYIRCTHDGVKSASNFEVDSKRRSYFGNDDGYVFKFAHKIDKIYADNGNEIDSFFITKAYDHGVPEDSKYTNHITTFSKYGESLKCSIDVNNNGSYDETNIPRIDKNIGFTDITTTGNRFRYMFYEKSDNKSWEFEGFTLSTDIKEHEE